ncbi:hypothetical protein Esti_001441 [Eimeria stiedai]
MSEAHETPGSECLYPRRGAGLRRRWGREETSSGLSPLVVASVPLAPAASSSFDFSEPASTPIMAAMALSNNDPTLSDQEASPSDHQHASHVHAAAESRSGSSGPSGWCADWGPQGKEEGGPPEEGTLREPLKEGAPTQRGPRKEGDSLSNGSSRAADKTWDAARRQARRQLFDLASADFATTPSSSSSSSNSSSNSNSNSSSRNVGGISVDPLLNPDGVTVRKPARLGIRSGDPVAAHILKTKTFNLSARLGPRPSRLNLSIHRRRHQGALWGSPLSPGGPPGGPPGAPPRRSPFAEDEAGSLPRLVQFSPSLRSALSRELRDIMKGPEEGPCAGSEAAGTASSSSSKSSSSSGGGGESKSQGLRGEPSDEAEREAEKQRAREGDAEACYLLGVSLFREGRVEEALEFVSAFLLEHSTSLKPLEPPASRKETDAAPRQNLTLHQQPTESGETAAPAPATAAEAAAEAADAEAAEAADAEATEAAAAAGEKENENSNQVTVSADRAPHLPGVSFPSGDGSNSSRSRKDSSSSSKSSSEARLMGGGVCGLKQLAGVVYDAAGHANRRSRDRLSGWPRPQFRGLEKLMGHLAFETEQFADAVRRYWRAIDLDPKDAQMFTSLGLAYYELEELKHAEAAFEHSLKLDDSNTTALSVLAMLLLDKSADEEEASPEPSEETQEGGSCSSEETDRVKRIRASTGRCVELLEKCLRLEKDNILAKLHLAQVFFFREEWGPSELIFRALLSEMPDDTHLLNNLGQVRFHQGDTAAAIQLHLRVLDVNPQDELAHLYLCEAFCTQQKYEEALSHFVRCCEASPDSVALHATCGLPLCEVGREQQVVAAYSAFIKKHPNSVAFKAFKRTLGRAVDEELTFFETASIISYIVVPVLVVVVLVLGFLSHPLWASSEGPPAEGLPEALRGPSGAEADRAHFGEF